MVRALGPGWRGQAFLVGCGHHGVLKQDAQFSQSLTLRYTLEYKRVPAICVLGKPDKISHCLIIWRKMIGLILKRDFIVSEKKIRCIEEYCNIKINTSPSRKSFEKYTLELIFGILWFLKACTILYKPGDYERDSMLPSHWSNVPAFFV